MQAVVWTLPSISIFCCNICHRKTKSGSQGQTRKCRGTKRGCSKKGNDRCQTQPFPCPYATVPCPYKAHSLTMHSPICTKRLQLVLAHAFSKPICCAGIITAGSSDKGSTNTRSPRARVQLQASHVLSVISQETMSTRPGSILHNNITQRLLKQLCWVTNFVNNGSRLITLLDLHCLVTQR